MPRATPASPIVRRAGASDLGALTALRIELWGGDRTEESEELRLLLPRADFAAFLACDGPRPVGFAEATIRGYADGVPTDRPAAYLEAIWVTRTWRRRGVAGALLGAVLDWAHAQGCGGIGSDAVLDNHASRCWHAAMGFAEVDHVVTYALPIEKRGQHGM